MKTDELKQLVDKIESGEATKDDELLFLEELNKGVMSVRDFIQTLKNEK